jgi:hypothetical protein
MTDDHALARELADEVERDLLSFMEGPVRVTREDAAEIIRLLRKWPEPDKDAARLDWLEAQYTLLLEIKAINISQQNFSMWLTVTQEER